MLFHFLSRFLPTAPRPFVVDLGLALVLLCAWLALGGFEPLVAAATDQLRLAVRPGAYRPQLPLGPAVVGAAGLVLAWLRHRFLGGVPQLQERLQRATLLTAALLALRLLALWDAPVYLFPFLTLLWSPHALWALALVFLGFVHLPPAAGYKTFRTGYVAAALLTLCLPLYLFYALYFCQITMLHGDESQYLRVTQSLLHDGDMDLANNQEAGYTDEFHVLEFDLQKAPASPEGKVHSVHPIGLSAALVPAYWWGLENWENPRLAAALFMALLASLCVPLLFLYLTRLGAEPWAALLATAITALTGPFFHYTNQLYPEVPALLIALAFWALLAAALFLRPRRRGLHWALVAAAALAPFLWSRSEAISARLGASLSPYMARLSSSETEAGIAPVKFHVPLRMTKAAQVDGRLRARPGVTSLGLVNSSLMGIRPLGIPHPGILRLIFPGLRVEPPDGQVSGHLTISSRYTVRVVSPWNSRSSNPLVVGEVEEDYPISFGSYIHE